MTTPQRLFDLLDPLLKKKPNSTLLAAKEGGRWREHSVREVADTVEKLAAGLHSLGLSANDMSVEGRDKIAILAKNRPEWVMLDLAVQKLGLVLVPIYPTVHVNDLQFVLKDAGVKYVFVNDEDLYHKVNTVRSAVPSLQGIYTFEHVSEAPHWTDLMTAGNQKDTEAIENAAARLTAEDLFTIIYTSGTTGTPKGVMLSHRNLLANIEGSIPAVPPGDDLKALSFLPLNHIFERMITFLYLRLGVQIWYAENLESIGDNLKEVKPDLFTTVPRLLEKVYDKIMAKGGELTGAKRKLFFWAHDLATKYEINAPQSFLERTQLMLANKLIFSKWREALGGNIKCIVSGGAACQVRLIRIFTAGGIPVLEGYGLTETSPVIAVNTYNPAGRKFGTVGPLLNNVEVKIAEDGEILCKGPNVMMGYYKRPDLTAAEMTDGWYKTGDIGDMVDGKWLKITDRKKELFKTSGGKYVAPLPIENKLKESPFVEQVMVVGPDRKFVGALIIPAFPYLRDWARGQGITWDSAESLIAHPKVQEHYKGLVESFNKYFNPVEQVKRFELLPHDWTVDSGELTPKMSLKRKVVMSKYGDAVERIYN